MKEKFSTFFFVRSYFAIVLGIFLVALALDALLADLSRSEEEANLIKQYSPHFVLLEKIIASGDKQNTDLNEALSYYEEIFPYPVNLFALSDFGSEQAFLRELEAGNISLYYDTAEPILYQRLANTPYVIQLGPIPFPETGLSHQEAFIISAYYGLIALLLFLWLRPFYRDLSQLRAAASEFGRQNFSTRVSLSDKSSILPVAQSFNAMAQRIEHLVSAHQELTNAVSHELRTPLARFRFSLEILGRSDDMEKKAQYLANMKDDVAELENLIDEMLSYARLSEDNLNLRVDTTDLNQLLRDIVAEYRTELVSLHFALSISPPGSATSCQINAELMSRAIHNILRNCLRYASSSINIHAQLKPDEVCITICDDGPGIPKEMHERILEPFSRLDTSRDRESGGYGLGLAIASRILEQHKGSIRVSNSAPNGACFHLCWPRTSA